MYNIQIFDTTQIVATKLFYSKIQVNYNEQGKWLSIASGAGQKITLSQVPVLIFDESITASTVIPEFREMWAQEVNDAYVSGYKTLIILTTLGTPIHLFTGQNIGIVEQKENMIHFTIEGKDVWIYNLGFMVLTR
jgi:hypothetical protein